MMPRPLFDPAYPASTHPASGARRCAPVAPHATTPAAPPDLRDQRLSLPREDLAEILREAGLPMTFALDWLLDRLEPPPPHGPR